MSPPRTAAELVEGMDPENPRRRETWIRKGVKDAFVWIIDTNHRWVNLKHVSEGRVEAVSRGDFAEQYEPWLPQLPERTGNAADPTKPRLSVLPVDESKRSVEDADDPVVFAWTVLGSLVDSPNQPFENKAKLIYTAWKKLDALVDSDA